MPWELRNFACVRVPEAARNGEERYWPTVLFWVVFPLWVFATAGCWVAFGFALGWQENYDLYTILFVTPAMLGTTAIVIFPLYVGACCPASNSTCYLPECSRPRGQDSELTSPTE